MFSIVSTCARKVYIMIKKWYHRPKANTLLVYVPTGCKYAILQCMHAYITGTTPVPRVSHFSAFFESVLTTTLQ